MWVIDGPKNLLPPAFCLCDVAQPLKREPFIDGPRRFRHVQGTQRGDTGQMEHRSRAVIHWLPINLVPTACFTEQVRMARNALLRYLR